MTISRTICGTVLLGGALLLTSLYHAACALFACCRCSEALWLSHQGSAGLMLNTVILARLIVGDLHQIASKRWALGIGFCLSSPLWIKWVFDVALGIYGCFNS